MQHPQQIVSHRRRRTLGGFPLENPVAKISRIRSLEQRRRTQARSFDRVAHHAMFAKQTQMRIISIAPLRTRRSNQAILIDAQITHRSGSGDPFGPTRLVRRAEPNPRHRSGVANRITDRIDPAGRRQRDAVQIVGLKLVHRGVAPDRNQSRSNK